MADCYSTKTTKLLKSRSLATRAVLWSIDKFTDTLVEALERRKTAVSVGPVRPFVLMLRAQLAADFMALAVRERALRRKNAEIAVLRREMLEALDETKDFIKDLKQVCEGLFDRATLTRLGFARRVERDAERVCEQAAMIVGAFQDPQIEIPQARLRLLNENWAEKSIAPLADLHQRLDDAMDALKAAESASRLALSDRNKVLEVYNNTFLWSARTLESLFRLARLDDLADRIRPSMNRPGLTEVAFDRRKARNLA